MPIIRFEQFSGDPRLIWVCGGCNKSLNYEAHWRGTIAGTLQEYHAHAECQERVQQLVDRDWELTINRELRWLYSSFDDQHQHQDYWDQALSNVPLGVKVISSYRQFINLRWPYLLHSGKETEFLKYWLKRLRRCRQIIDSFAGNDVSIDTNRYFIQVPSGWFYRDLDEIYDYGPTSIRGNCRGGRFVAVQYDGGKTAQYLCVALDCKPSDQYRPDTNSLVRPWDEEGEIWQKEQKLPNARAYMPVYQICVGILGTRGIST